MASDGECCKQALRDTAQDLRAMAAARFALSGSGDDARGAAIWDAACYVDPDDVL